MASALRGLTKDMTFWCSSLVVLMLEKSEPTSKTRLKKLENRTKVIEL